MLWQFVGYGAGTLTTVIACLLAIKWRFTAPLWQAPDHEFVTTVAQNDELSHWFEVEVKAHPGLTGIQVLDTGRDAFSARLHVIRDAKHSIDVQYYMWNADLSGSLLFREILHAADRNVAIRILLDDNTTLGNDAMLSALNSHRNIQIRLFNPFMLRRFRVLNYLVDFRRLNRRMHNKSLTVDGVATIVGGRNIGDAYFNATEGMQFSDMDVVAVGHAVSAVSKSFESYWKCKSSFAAETVLKKPTAAALEHLRTELKFLAQGEVASAYVKTLSTSDVLRELKSSTLAFEWVNAVLVVDDPAKGQGDIPRRRLLMAGLETALGEVKSHIDVATAYFVPGRFGLRFLSTAAMSGKRVRVLTNSLASNDVVPVHAGYARYRKRLLRQGVSLYELRSKVVSRKTPRRGKRKIPRFGASSSSLHAKIFTMDGTRVFIGSFNFDPRSLYLNCEMGLLIDSPKLVGHVTKRMEEFMTRQSYTPFLEHNGRLSWRDADNTVHKMEPKSTVSQRVVAWLISWLPVEWLL